MSPFSPGNLPSQIRELAKGVSIQAAAIADPNVEIDHALVRQMAMNVLTLRAWARSLEEMAPKS
jgi:hypothetical protein